jgi:adenosylhomocysteine nucleosidase
MPMPILVSFAVKEEAEPFQEFAKSNGQIGVVLTGIGRKNAEKSLTGYLSANTPKLVLSCGFAGALNPDLKVGDVLFDEDPEAGFAEILRESGASPAKLHCASRVAVTAAEKAQLRRETAADAVEMESGIIRRICHERKIPSATIRVISDAAHEDLPLDFNALMTPDQAISFPRLAAALLKSPGKVPQLLELQRNTRFAAQKLAEVLGQLLRALDTGGRTRGGAL